jgi:threonine dehydratase
VSRPSLSDPREKAVATMTVTAADVRAAAELLKGRIHPTPAEAATRLSESLGCDLFLKLENQHLTGSFKERGALNRLLRLTEAERKGGVIAISAGNHAQAVACHASRLGIAATIIMPTFTPFTKIERTQAYGARVVLEGETLNDSQAFARELAEREGLTLVHPYDDPHIIAGQGTAALEFLDSVPDLDVLVCPIGGGGLISGMALAARERRPDLTIIGVQCTSYPSMKQALAGETPTCGGATIAEGIAVKAPGAFTKPLVAALVDDIVLVDEIQIEVAVYQMATVQKLVAEGAGAASLAAVLANPERFAGKRVGLVVSGGNIDPRLLAQVLMRGLVHDGRIVRLRVPINDTPGVLGKVSRLLGDAGANIVDVHHQRLYHNVPVKMADLDVILETRDRLHVQQLLARLHAAGFAAQVMDDVS